MVVKKVKLITKWQFFPMTATLKPEHFIDISVLSSNKNRYGVRYQHVWG